jgi:hypothetical protein
MCVLLCGWSKANARRQRARVYGRAQARLVSKPRRLHQLAARHGADPTPCQWMFGERWIPALICDAPNLHNRGRGYPYSILSQIRTATSMLFPIPTPFPNHILTRHKSSIPSSTAQDHPIQSALHRSFLVAVDLAARGKFNLCVIHMFV